MIHKCQRSQMPVRYYRCHVPLIAWELDGFPVDKPHKRKKK